MALVEVASNRQKLTKGQSGALRAHIRHPRPSTRTLPRDVPPTYGAASIGHRIQSLSSQIAAPSAPGGLRDESRFLLAPSLS
jgi:hypothetical protein